jgi:hypothetical protein
MITQAFAEHFAQGWVDAWNSHDLDRILAHYSDDFVMSSPQIAVIASEPSGTLGGKESIRAYWKRALELAPTLHFDLLGVFVGVDTVVLHYVGVRGPAAEIFFFGADGKVVKAAAHYRPIYKS